MVAKMYTLTVLSVILAAERKLAARSAAQPEQVPITVARTAIRLTLNRW